MKHKQLTIITAFFSFFLSVSLYAQQGYQTLEEALNVTPELVCGIALNKAELLDKKERYISAGLFRKEVAQIEAPETITFGSYDLSIRPTTVEEEGEEVPYFYIDLKDIMHVRLENRPSAVSTWSFSDKNHKLVCGITPFNTPADIVWHDLPSDLVPRAPVAGSNILIMTHHLDIYDWDGKASEKSEEIAEHYIENNKPVIGVVSATPHEDSARFALDIDQVSFWYFEPKQGKIRLDLQTTEKVLNVILTGGYFTYCVSNTMRSILVSAKNHPTIEKINFLFPMKAVTRISSIDETEACECRLCEETPQESHCRPFTYETLYDFQNRDLAEFTKVINAHITMAGFASAFWKNDHETSHDFHSNSIRWTGNDVLGPYIELTFASQIPG